MRRFATLPAVLCLIAAGCGGEDSGFTAEQFVSAVNQRGASLELGPELRTTRADAQVYALEVLDAATAGDPAESHGGGSLAVMPSADAGLEEYKRCEDAASLLCFRADNIVLLLEGDIPTQTILVLTGALRSIAEETAD